MYKRYGFPGLTVLILGLVIVVGEHQGFVADAGSISGKGIALKGLDNFAGTVQDYAKGNIGKMVGMIIAMAGIAGMAFQRVAMGLSALGAGIAIAFVPNIIGTAFDKTAAAPHVMMAPAPVLLAAGSGVLNTLGQVGLVLLWPLMVVLKYVRDPVVWVALSLVALARPWLAAGLLRGQAQLLRRDGSRSLGRVG